MKQTDAAKIMRTGKPMYQAVYDHYQQAIRSGRMKRGERMPSVRKLADLMNVSTTPIEQAYQQLVAEGFIESRPRSGYFVCADADSSELNAVNEAGTFARRQLLRDPHAYRYDFHLSKNDFSLFPRKLWRRLLSNSLDRDEALHYGDPQGDPRLRRAIADYLRLYRGVRCSGDQIVVAADPSVLASYLAMMIPDHPFAVGVENPGYPLIGGIFARHGKTVLPIPLDDGGIEVGALERSNVGLVAVSPSHQYPMGTLMPISRRLALLDWSKRTGGIILEDDYDGELRYDGRPVPALQGLRPDANVIYMGGFAQLLSPAVCIHYMALPRDWVARFDRLQLDLLFEHTASPLLQDALRMLMEQGYWEQHVRKMRNHYRKKHDRLVEAVRATFGGRAELVGTGAGFYALLRLRGETRTERELIAAAREAGVRVASTAYTWHPAPNPERKEFFLGFGGIPVELIEEGVRALYDAWY